MAQMAKLESEDILTHGHAALADIERPAVLMLHGFFGGAQNWRACAEALSAHSRVLAPELPLFGEPRREDSLERLTGYLSQFIETEKARRLIVVGNSLGGQLAVNLALRQPLRIVGLVLTGSSGLQEWNLTYKIQRRPVRAWVYQRIAEVFCDASLVTDAMVDEVQTIFDDREKYMDALMLLKSIRATSLRGLLPQVRCPALLVWGTEDQVTPPGTANNFKRLLPDAELHFISRCGHAPMIESPEEFNRLVESFVFRLAGRRSTGPRFENLRGQIRI